MQNTNQLLGEILIETGVIRQSDLNRALQNQNGQLLGKTLLGLNACSEDELLEALSRQLGVPRASLPDTTIQPDALALITPKVAFHYHIIPLRHDGTELVIATSEPQDIAKLDEIELLTGTPVTPVLCGEEEIRVALKKYYGLGAEMADTIASTSADEPASPVGVEVVEDIEHAADSSSVINFVNNILLEGYRQQATDIHLEPTEDDLKIRFRVDGFLTNIKTPETARRFKDAIVSRLKVMASLDIAEKRKAQDGRMKVKVGADELDLRISILPSIYGQTVNIRLLNSMVHYLDLARLGFSETDLQTVESVISKPHGMVLLTGPTGSGKTTTLYSALRRIRSDEMKIITIEDPIEYRLEGITQIQTLPKIGLTFANGLRSVLRHDPDIIMVGEIRDSETAKIAVQSALTGHLVFSTLHTNDAASAITRLCDMGVEPFLIASTVECVIAQRLPRMICERCKTETPIDRKLLKGKWLNATNIPPTLWEGRGCEACHHTGFRGRTGIFEVLRVDNDIREMITSTTHSNRIKELARKRGMTTILEDGMRKVARGVTTLSDIIRVTHEEELDT